MDKGGYVQVLRRLAIVPPGRPDTGLPLPLAILVEALRDRAGLPAVIGSGKGHGGAQPGCSH